MNNLHICVAIPTYNGALSIEDALDSLYKQIYTDFSVIISDDCSTDATVEVIESYIQKNAIKNIKLYKNKKNLGCSGNFRNLHTLAHGDILFLFCQDDVLFPNALYDIAKAFHNKEVGVATRPYYWFDEDIHTPYRAVYPLSKDKDIIVDLHHTNRKEIEKVVESVGQASGLAYRLKDMTADFHDDIFVTHIYPFFALASIKKIVFLHNYILAVRIKSSQSRNVKSVYKKSPLLSWITMFDSVFTTKDFSFVNKVGKEQLLTHYEGLVQIRSYSTFRNFIHEVMLFLQFRQKNIVEPKFWFYTILCILTPRTLLQWAADAYKEHILSKTIHLS